MERDDSRVAIPADPNDPEDFDVTERGVLCGLRGREIRRARHALGLTLEEFAARFPVPVDDLRDWELSRAMPPAFAVTHALAIAADPAVMARAVEAAGKAGKLAAD